MINTICAIADLQGFCTAVRPEELPDADLLLIAGDLTGHGDLRQLGTFDNWLATLEGKYRHKVIVAGNHDLGLARNIDGHQFFQNAIYLQDELLMLEDLKIYGTPLNDCGPYARNWEFCDPKYIKRAAENIPEGVDIVLVHGPLKGILDETPFGDHIGSIELWNAVFKANPKLVVCGHNHAGFGSEKLYDTLIVNAALCDDYNVLADKNQKLLRKPFLLIRDEKGGFVVDGGVE